MPLLPPTKVQLCATTQQEAITKWQNSWMAAPRLQLAYLALTNPPDGNIHPFIQGITKFLRPIVATCIRLLTGHAFTSEYTAYFCPSSFDSHHCQWRFTRTCENGHQSQHKLVSHSSILEQVTCADSASRAQKPKPKPKQTMTDSLPPM